MLIQSDRHTTKDLVCWEELERADREHAASLDGKIDGAVRAIREFSKEPCYAGVSWGKDSAVLAHLVATSGVRIPLVWIRVEPIKNPDCELVRDEFLRKWDCDYHEVEVWCRQGHDDWHASGTLEKGAKECEHRFGARRILGIRANESSIRRLTCFRNGVSSANSCRPLAWWTVADVMAYLASRKVPTHPAYAMLGGGRYEREWLRVASLGGKRGDGMGRAEWERCYYGDVLNRMKAMTCIQK